MNAMGHRKVLIFFVLAATLALVWLAVGQRTSRTEPDPSMEPVTEESPSAMEAPDSTGREVVALEVPQSAIVEVSAVTDAKAAAKAELDAAISPYREKYQGFSKDQLVLANYDLDRKVKSELDRISKEVLASGELDLAAPSTGDTPPTQTTSAKSPVMSVVSKFGPGADGDATWRQRVIDAETYPEFHALQMEQWWVAGELRHIEKSGK